MAEIPNAPSVTVAGRGQTPNVAGRGQTPNFTVNDDVQRSRAQQEVALAAAAAANVETETIEGKITKARNLDFHDLIDGLDKNIKNATADMSNILKDLIRVSPSTKKAKSLTSVQSRIVQCLDEIERLEKLNAATNNRYQERLNQAIDNLDRLYAERDGLNDAAMNLNSVMN